MPSYVLSRAAEGDLSRIAVYTIEKFGVEQAITYRDSLVRVFALLAENPQLARRREELKPPLRAHRFQSHLIFYDVQPDGKILIVRIRHGREDWLTDEG